MDEIPVFERLDNPTHAKNDLDDDLIVESGGPLFVAYFTLWTEVREHIEAAEVFGFGFQLDAYDVPVPPLASTSESVREWRLTVWRDLIAERPA